MDQTAQDRQHPAAIDAHQHFWQYDAHRHAWINDEMAVIRKDFLPPDLEPVLRQNNISGTVAVQADQTEAETDFLLELANRYSFIKGVVGWIDLMADDAAERLEHYAAFEKMKGIRHILQGEEPSFMLQPAFLHGISLLQRFGLTYDILIYPQHLAAALELVSQFPQQPFVIDHIAKPFIKAGLIDDWKRGMAQLAKRENVHCKISGMVTEADMRNWKNADFRPYLDAVTERFGTSRIFYGSDWPVCLAAGSYQVMMNIATEYFASFSSHEKERVFAANATAFYHLT